MKSGVTSVAVPATRTAFFKHAGGAIQGQQAKDLSGKDVKGMKIRFWGGLFLILTAIFSGWVLSPPMP
jgi:cytochrome b subunit of formate dehydrogenase